MSGPGRRPCPRRRPAPSCCRAGSPTPSTGPASPAPCCANQCDQYVLQWRSYSSGQPWRCAGSRGCPRAFSKAGLQTGISVSSNSVSTCSGSATRSVKAIQTSKSRRSGSTAGLPAPRRGHGIASARHSEGGFGFAPGKALAAPSPTGPAPARISEPKNAPRTIQSANCASLHATSLAVCSQVRLVDASPLPLPLDACLPEDPLVGAAPAGEPTGEAEPPMQVSEQRPGAPWSHVYHPRVARPMNPLSAPSDIGFSRRCASTPSSKFTFPRSSTPRP